MNRMWLGLATSLCALWLGVATTGCQAEAQVTTAPPPQPPADSDGDGIADGADKCPNDKEDKLPPTPDDGCPNPDPDGDGVLADADKCPDAPETKNDFEDADGCPDEKPKPKPVFKGVHLTLKKVEIDEHIKFETNSATISHDSDQLIKNIAGVVKGHPDLDFIEVAGHADKRGSDKLNRKLTQERAEAVVERLVTEGVDAKRLRAVGYGPFCPLDTADTDEAHAANRRVEFIILRRAAKDLDAKWGGCPGAKAKGMAAARIPASAPKTKPKAVPAKKAIRVPGKIVRTGTVLTLPENPRFATDSAELSPEAEKVLTLLKDYLVANPDITKLRIEGHAAKLKNNKTLEKLSAARARSVVKWLVSHGIDAERLFAVGCGAKRLVLGDDGKPDLVESKRTEAHVVETNGVQEADEPLVPGDCEPVED